MEITGVVTEDEGIKLSNESTRFTTAAGYQGTNISEGYQSGRELSISDNIIYRKSVVL